MAVHHFEVGEAVDYGIESAILLSNIRYWLAKNKTSNTNLRDGFYWTYNSAKALKELFPYMSERTISRRLKELCDKGALKSGNYNKASFDKTPWYTIPNEFIAVKSAKEPVKSTIRQSGESISQSGESISQSGETIPNNKTQIENTDLKTTATATREPKKPEIEKPAVAAKSKNETSLPDYQKPTADEIAQTNSWLDSHVDSTPLVEPMNPNDIVLTSEQLACYQWAMLELTFWRAKINSKTKFISLYEKPDSALKHQYETDLLKQQAQKSPAIATYDQQGLQI